MGDIPHDGIKMDDLLENLPTTSESIFNNIGVWESISQYMNPMMAALEGKGRQAADLMNTEMIENEQLAHVEELEDMLVDVDDTYMTFAEAARLRRSQRDSMLNQVRQLHQSMMFIRRLAGMRGRELYRHHRN